MITMFSIEELLSGKRYSKLPFYRTPYIFTFLEEARQLKSGTVPIKTCLPSEEERNTPFFKSLVEKMMSRGKSSINSQREVQDSNTASLDNEDKDIKANESPQEKTDSGVSVDSSIAGKRSPKGRESIITKGNSILDNSKGGFSLINIKASKYSIREGKSNISQIKSNISQIKSNISHIKSNISQPKGNISQTMSNINEIKSNPLENIKNRSLMDHQSSLMDHQSSLMDHRSSLKDHRSSLKDHRSSLKDHRSSLIDHKSSVMDNKSNLMINKSNLQESNSIVEVETKVNRERENNANSGDVKKSSSRKIKKWQEEYEAMRNKREMKRETNPFGYDASPNISLKSADTADYLKSADSSFTRSELNIKNKFKKLFETKHETSFCRKIFCCFCKEKES